MEVEEIVLVGDRWMTVSQLKEVQECRLHIPPDMLEMELMDRNPRLGVGKPWLSDTRATAIEDIRELHRHLISSMAYGMYPDRYVMSRRQYKVFKQSTRDSHRCSVRHARRARQNDR